MDYRILSMMQELVCQDMVELRQRLVDTWTEFQQSIVDEVIEKCHNRLHSSRRGRSLRTLAIRSDFPDSCIVTVVVLDFWKHIYAP